MFGIDSTELAVIALVALLVIGPKDLPRVMRYVGNWLAKGRAMTRHVRAGFDTMMREAELEEMQKQWAAQNEAIMKATALPDLTPDLGLTDIAAESWTAPEPPVVAEPEASPPEAAAKPMARKRVPKAVPIATAPVAPIAEAPLAPIAEVPAAPKRKRTPKPKPAAVES
jgi:sec-independent protein translocase protein TatB